MDDVDARCSRCGGTGVLPQFNHICNGVCFRCWGKGEDPRTVEQLRRWLEKARKEYRNRLAILKRSPNLSPQDRARLERELRLIASLGKKNRAWLLRLTTPCPSCKAL